MREMRWACRRLEPSAVPDQSKDTAREEITRAPPALRGVVPFSPRKLWIRRFAVDKSFLRSADRAASTILAGAYFNLIGSSRSK